MLAEAINSVDGGNALAAQNASALTEKNRKIIVIATEDNRPMPTDFQLHELREDLVVVDTSLDPKTSTHTQGSIEC